MANIIVPQTGVFKVYRNNLQLDPAMVELVRKKQVPNIFNNPENTYIINIPKTVNSVQQVSGHLFESLNLKGSLELNLPCPLYFYREEEPKPKNLDETYMSRDRLDFKNIIINCTNPDKSEISCEINSSEISDKQQTIEKITLNAKQVNVKLYKFLKLKELNVLAENINNCYLECPKLEKLNFTNLSNFNLSSNYWTQGFQIFKDIEHTARLPDGNYKHTKESPIPDNCIVTFNKKTTFSTEEKIESQLPLLGEDFDFWKIKMTDFINKNTAKSYTETSNTFSLRFDELKILISKEILKHYENHLSSVKTYWQQEAKNLEDKLTKETNQEIKK